MKVLNVFFVIFEQALGPKLRSLMAKCPNGNFSPQTSFKLIYQLVERLRRLHELGYVHNDVKMENILVGHDDTDVVYLIDFGLTYTYLNENGGHIKKQ